MEDFLLGLLGFIFELLIDAGFELILGEIVAGAYRSARRFRVTARRGNTMLATAILVLIGLALGFVSAIIFPHPLIHPSKLHGVSLLISPLLTGFGMSAIGRGVRRRGRIPVQIESFAYGFTFAFAFALIRLLVVH